VGAPISKGALERPNLHGLAISRWPRGLTRGRVALEQGAIDCIHHRIVACSPSEAALRTARTEEVTEQIDIGRATHRLLGIESC
jgi:hypothetical protein